MMKKCHSRGGNVILDVKSDYFRNLEILDFQIDKHRFWRVVFCDERVEHTCRKCLTRTRRSREVISER